MTTLTYTDFYNQNGPAEYALMTPAYSWQSKAYISMGNSMHGDNLNTNWQTLYSGVANYSTLRAMWWTDIVPWVWLHPAADNTCTNAAVQVYDFQIQIYNTNTRAWELVSTPSAGRELRTSIWYDMPTNNTSGGACDLIYPGRYNLPAFSNVKVSGDRSAAATIPGDEAKFWASHNGVTRAAVADPSLIGGVALMCKAKLVSVDGAALNGTPKIMMAIGCDAYPDHTATINTGLFTGVYISPSMVIGGFSKVTTTEKVILATSALLRTPVSDVIVSTSSDYQQSFPAGTYPQCMSAALFAANVPQFSTF